MKLELCERTEIADKKNKAAKKYKERSNTRIFLPMKDVYSENEIHQFLCKPRTDHGAYCKTSPERSKESS